MCYLQGNIGCQAGPAHQAKSGLSLPTAAAYVQHHALCSVTIHEPANFCALTSKSARRVASAKHLNTRRASAKCSTFVSACARSASCTTHVVTHSTAQNAYQRPRARLRSPAEHKREQSGAP